MTEKQTQLLTENMRALREVQALRADRAKVLNQIENASMFEKASLISRVAMVSLDVETRLLACVANLCKLAAVDAFGTAGALEEPETEGDDNGEETEQH